VQLYKKASMPRDDSRSYTGKIAFLVDTMSFVQPLAPGDAYTLSLTTSIPQRTELVNYVILQWETIHCGTLGNNRADTLTKEVELTEQTENPSTYGKARTVIKQVMKNR